MSLFKYCNKVDLNKEFIKDLKTQVHTVKDYTQSMDAEIESINNQLREEELFIQNSIQRLEE